MTPLLDIEKYKKSFKEASYDRVHKESLITDERKEVYIFDDIAKAIADSFEMDIPSSCDSVVLRGEDIYLIEFKNRDYEKVNTDDKRDIRKKAYQSRELLLSTFLEDKTLQYVSEHVQLLVVFKTIDNKAKSYDNIVDSMKRLAKDDRPVVRCKLDKFEGTFYKKVRTISKVDFEENYMPKIFA